MSFWKACSRSGNFSYRLFWRGKFKLSFWKAFNMTNLELSFWGAESEIEFLKSKFEFSESRIPNWVFEKSIPKMSFLKVWHNDFKIEFFESATCRFSNWVFQKCIWKNGTELTWNWLGIDLQPTCNWLATNGIGNLLGLNWGGVGIKQKLGIFWWKSGKILGNRKLPEAARAKPSGKYCRNVTENRSAGRRAAQTDRAEILPRRPA